MTLSRSTLTAIQRAGQAVFEAHAALAEATSAQAARVSEALASKSLAPQSDALFSDWKAIAKLAQEFESVESQMRALFAKAGELQASERVPSAGVPATEPGTEPASKAVSKRAVKKSAPKKAAPKPKAKGDTPISNTPPSNTPAPASGLQGNNAKVLAYLNTILNRDSYIRIPQARIADAVGIPKGSINLSIRQLRAKNLLEEGAKKHYKLL